MKKTTIKILAICVMLIASLAIFALSASAESENETFFINGVEIPKFDFISRPYSRVEDMNLPIEKIKEAFNIMPEFKCENGKYMVSDIGADEVEIYNDRDYDFIKMTLENGYWVAEISEEDIKNPELNWSVYFKSEENLWEFYYHNEEPSRRVQFVDYDTMKVIGIYTSPSEDWMDVSYAVMDNNCTDFYRNGEIESHDVTHYFDDKEDWFAAVYNPDKTLNNIKIWHNVDGTYYYLIPEYGWYTVPTPYPDYKIDTPVGYEDVEIEYFVSIAPCVIDCTHESLIPATCEEPAMCRVCGFVADGAEALGHDIILDKAVDPTCTETGLTEGYHCSRCDGMTAPQIEVPALEHNTVIDEAVSPTCTETGLTDGYHCLRCDEKLEQETVPSLGHDWIDADFENPKRCNICGETDRSPLPENTESESEYVSEAKSEANSEVNSEVNSEANSESESTSEKDTGSDKVESSTTSSEDDSESAGCASSISIGAITLASICGMAVAYIKKKED